MTDIKLIMTISPATLPFTVLTHS